MSLLYGLHTIGGRKHRLCISFAGKTAKGWKSAYNGVDRINSTDGYSISNCVPCCETCNKMKLDYDQHDFLEHVKKITNNIFGMED